MKTINLLVVSTLLMVSAVVQGQVKPTGVVQGVVNFTGTILPPEAMEIRGDRFCQDVSAKKPILREDVVVNPNKTLKNVVVWVASGGPDNLYKSTGTSLEPAVLVQQDCSFYPHLVAIQTGQKLVVKNVDPTIHNLNTYPKNNKRLNKAILPGGSPETISFEKPEIAVRIKSDIHPWMVAWAAVFDHPFYAITGDDGTFEIKGLPPGEYTLETWHEKFGNIRMYALVQGDTPTHVVFNYTNDGSKGAAQVDAHGNASTGTLQQEEPPGPGSPRAR